MLIVGLFCCTSCKVVYNIKVHNNGTANVEQGYFGSPDDSELEEFFNSDIISNVDTVSVPSAPGYIHMNFLIEKIDSLGRYLTFFNPSFISFTQHDYIFKIHFSGENPFEWDLNYQTHMYIEFDKKVNKVLAPDIKAKKKGDYQVDLHVSTKTLRNKGQPSIIKIILED